MNDIELDDLIGASSLVLGLPIKPARQDGVRMHLRIMLDMAARIDAFPLPDDSEPAAVFIA